MNYGKEWQSRISTTTAETFQIKFQLIKTNVGNKSGIKSKNSEIYCFPGAFALTKMQNPC